MLVTEKKKINLFYQALLERNQRFVGLFFVGVKTTSVFCIATCRARKPKLENLAFYTSLKDALYNGYSPCKVCKPTEKANQAPEQVEKAILSLKAYPKEKKVTDYQLREMGISPEFVRRWFLKSYGMTFQTFQRMCRINNAFYELKKRKNVIQRTYDVGYGSWIGFGYTRKKLIGKSSQKNQQKNIILISRLTTPLGPMVVCATDHGICLLEFVDRPMLETEFRDLQRLLRAAIILGENEHSKQAQKEITEYFSGKRKKFDVNTETPGTDFQNSVWNCLQEIEYGTTITYQQQAKKLNNVQALRAVASANGFNRISIIVPCHRVIGKDGAMRGYGGGIERKEWLLHHERENASVL